MNGCDHQPLQPDIIEAIAVANQLYPDVEFIHSTLNDYVRAVKVEIPVDLITIEGELRSQMSDGFGTLVNTASSRLYLKRANYLAQTQLTRMAEPLATMFLPKEKYPFEQLLYGWKILMENHPHDSICGCSVDEVHAENMTRFMKATEVGKYVETEALDYFCQTVDTQDIKAEYAFTVVNSYGKTKTDSILVELELAKAYYAETEDMSQAKKELAKLEPPNLVSLNGAEIPALIEDLGVCFGYELPKVGFRRAYHSRKIRVQIVAELAGYSWQTYLVTNGARNEHEYRASNYTIENEQVAVILDAVQNTITLSDKVQDKKYENALIYEDTGDCGNEYVYYQTKDGQSITSEDIPYQNIVCKKTAIYEELRYTQTLMLPVSAAKTLEDEQKAYVWFTQRQSQRSDEKIACQIETTIRIFRGNNRIELQTKVNNKSKDHRLRLRIPTTILADSCWVDSIYEIVERPTIKPTTWKNPDYTQHQSAFVNLHTPTYGVTVANRGLSEYEVIPETGEIVLTLLRATGELGDWGVFPTPEAQCIGEYMIECAIIFHGENPYESFDAAYGYQSPFVAKQVPIGQVGQYPTEMTYLEWFGTELAPTALKRSWETTDVVFRSFNMNKEKARELLLKSETETYKTTILEEFSQEVKPTLVGPAEIITIGLKK